MRKIAISILVLIVLLTSPVYGFNNQENLELLNESISIDLPSYFSWRDIDGIDFTTPIRNQVRLPSCETFAITAAVETMVQYKVGYPFGCDLSEAHLYFFSGGNTDWGSFPENDTNFLKKYGIPDESCWPYPKDNFQYPLNTTSHDWKNRTVKIANWSYLPEDINAIKSALVNNGPVPTYFQVFEDFVHYKDGIYRHRWGKYSGIHYVCIVGYNDEPGYWIVKNSWGPKYLNEVIPSSNSMTTTTLPIDSIQATRIHLRRLIGILKKDKCTSMVTTEIPEGSRDLSRDSISEFLVDGILVLDLDTTMDRRKLTIRKMRGTKHTLKPHEIGIGEQGISLL